MATDFVYTNPEAARQAIAQLQLRAALAENVSREAIAREQTAASRYATQAQINEREKDRAVAREEIASRDRYRTGGETDRLARERANIQYSTILDSLNVADPMTKSELEAKLAASQLSDDLKNDLRSRRDQVYKNAVANAAMGERLAKNYTKELEDLKNAKYPDAKVKAALYKRLQADKDVLFDATTGTVTSRWRQPREDAAVPNVAGAGAGVKTLDQIRAAATGGGGARIPVASDIGSAAPVAVPEPVKSSPLLPPAQMSYGGGFAIPNRLAVVRSADMAPPPQQAPLAQPSFVLPFNSVGLNESFKFPSPPPQQAQFLGNDFTPRKVFTSETLNSLPYAVPQSRLSLPSNDQINELVGIASHPDFSSLPIADQQWVRDQINGWQMMNMPRSADLQTIRPEFRPPVEGYAP